MHTHKPNGLQRAALRAHAKGLRVGYPVRAVLSKAQALNWPDAVPGKQYGQAHYAGPEGAVPLEFGERIGNYRIQQAVRTHSIGGTKWRPTPRQRRRLDHKANRAAAPFKRPQPEPFAEPAPRGPMIAQGEGFRVVDRRGEHR